MDRSPWIAVVSSLVLAACAHAHDDSMEPRAPERMAELDTPPPSSSSMEPSAAAVQLEPPPAEVTSATQERAASRPRLSHTITLGQGAEPEFVPSPEPGPAGAAQQGTSIVINNNVIVQGAAPYYGGYGGYGGYGYGYYGSGGRAGYGRASSDVSRGGAHSYVAPQWSTTGWEGPGRTAAPGHTPGVGGNWAPVPSYGPRPMR